MGVARSQRRWASGSRERRLESNQRRASWNRTAERAFDELLETYYRLVMEADGRPEDPLEAKLALARFIVARAHGEEAARVAEEHFTRVVRATRLDHRLLSVPRPVERKPGMRPRKHRGMTLRFLPTPAAVGGHFHLVDHARTGPGQAGNLGISP